jgi:hypothetical protein
MYGAVMCETESPPLADCESSIFVALDDVVGSPQHVYSSQAKFGACILYRFVKADDGVPSLEQVVGTFFCNGITMWI